jgi:hypothetical protein
VFPASSELGIMRIPIVQLQQFIQAIRDAGYRGTGSALAELVDNAYEAEAGNVDIAVRVDPEGSNSQAIVVSDDGSGMSPAILELALQFGGSSRFGQRTGTGRFGMGLPNSSVSQARRLEVFTWKRPSIVWWSYLDVDEILDGSLREIPAPVRRRLPEEYGIQQAKSGTVVIWKKCDRLNFKRESALIRRLKRDLGRTFRRMMLEGKKLRINGEELQPVDPLFLRDGDNLVGAIPYGEELEYQIRDASGFRCKEGMIIARFVELPISKWISLSNAEKQEFGISKNAGISILRAGREIDYGWFFMGGKRKENYDDWWRCEVEFPPQLDELFGVTHTKQGIAPSNYLLRLLTPDFEAIAHKLNARVRSTFLKIKSEKLLSSERRAGECDNLFAPPTKLKIAGKLEKNQPVGERNAGLRFKLISEALGNSEFYIPKVKGVELQLILNEKHPFCERLYHPIQHQQRCDPRMMTKALELILFAAARAEIGMESVRTRSTIQAFRRAWSDLMAAYLS